MFSFSILYFAFVSPCFCAFAASQFHQHICGVSSLPSLCAPSSLTRASNCTAIWGCGEHYPAACESYSECSCGLNGECNFNGPAPPPPPPQGCAAHWGCREHYPAACESAPGCACMMDGTCGSTGPAPTTPAPLTGLRLENWNLESAGFNCSSKPSFTQPIGMRQCSQVNWNGQMNNKTVRALRVTSCSTTEAEVEFYGAFQLSGCNRDQFVARRKIRGCFWMGEEGGGLASALRVRC